MWPPGKFFCDFALRLEKEEMRSSKGHPGAGQPEDRPGDEPAGPGDQDKADGHPQICAARTQQRVWVPPQRNSPRGRGRGHVRK